MSKKSLISGYISKCNMILETEDRESAKILEEEIISVYNAEINGLKDGLDSYNNIYENKVDYVKDIRYLKAKLENYKGDLKLAAGTGSSTKKTTFNINNTLSSSVYNEINISLNNTIKNINSLPNDILNNDEKEELEDKLSGLQRALDSDDKNKIWKKLSNILKYAITKGPEVFIAISNFINFVSNTIAPLFK